MDAIYDAVVAMDDLYLQHLLFDLECHELIVLLNRLVADSILKISTLHRFQSGLHFLTIKFKKKFTHFSIDCDSYCRSLLMQESYLDWRVCYDSTTMGYTHVMRSLQKYCYLCVVMRSYPVIVFAPHS